MRRFFVDPANIVGNRVVIDGPEARHLAKVLRLKAGERVRLYDGSGMVYEAVVASTAKGLVKAEVLTATRDEGAGRPDLHLGQALPKAKKMDFIIQKATELGVAAIHPFVSEYCVGQTLAGDREERRAERWQRVAQEACKQCGRPTPPACQPIKDFASLVRTDDLPGLRLICWEDEAVRSLAAVFAERPVVDSVMILVGPEGGFSTAEIGLAGAAGFQPVSLGRYTLRTETAALAATAVLQYILGNMAGS